MIGLKIIDGTPTEISKYLRERNTNKNLYDFEGNKVGYYEVIEWWLENYKGMEHLHNNPETMYTINSILERCLNKLKEKK